MRNYVSETDMGWGGVVARKSETEDDFDIFVADRDEHEDEVLSQQLAPKPMAKKQGTTSWIGSNSIGKKRVKKK